MARVHTTSNPESVRGFTTLDLTSSNLGFPAGVGAIAHVNEGKSGVS